MAEISYGNCQKCNSVNDIYTIYQYTKSNNLTNRGKKFFCICYSCSDLLIKDLNAMAKESPQNFIPIPFDPLDSRKNARVVLTNCIYENNIFELVNEHIIEKEEKLFKSTEDETMEPVENQKPSLTLLEGGKQGPRKPTVPGCLPSYSAAEIYEKLNKQIIGQDEALQTLAIVTERYLESLKDTNVKKMNLLITGNTSMGKTESVFALENIVGIPVLSYNMKHFTASGYVGKEVSEIINQICEVTNNQERPRAIILLDEIDKLGQGDSTDSFIKTDVYYEIMTYLEGRRAVVNGKKGSGEAAKNVDTSELLFIMAGSFHKIMDKKVEKNNYIPVGLGKETSNIIQLKAKDLTPIITNEDLMKSGMPKEFIGRIHVRVPYRTLSEAEYVEVIKQSSSSPLNSYHEYFRKRNVEIEFKDEYLAHIAKIVCENGLGVRGVISVIENDLKREIFNVHRYAGQSIVVKSGGVIEKSGKQRQLRN